jgi:hypothetical protein
VKFDSNQILHQLADSVALFVSAPARFASLFSYSTDSYRVLEPFAAQHTAMAVSVALAPLRRCQPLDARGRALVTFAILSLAYLVGADDEFVGAGQSSWRNLIGQDPVPSDADFDFEYFHGRHLALSYTFSKCFV